MDLKSKYNILTVLLFSKVYIFSIYCLFSSKKLIWTIVKIDVAIATWIFDRFYPESGGRFWFWLK